VNSIREKTFAWYSNRTARAVDVALGEDKRRLLEHVEGLVMELGAGDGKNLQYYPSNTDIVLVEPNPSMVRYIRKNFDATGVVAAIVSAHGEQLPFPEDKFDAVFSAHALCSVQDVPRTLQEVKRVLKPGGTFAFIEHVAAKKGTFVRTLQNATRWAHSLIFAGCQCNRAIGKEIENAGFTSVQMTYENRKFPLPTVVPHIIGRAVK
jgi:ubiquinone/menaquinone biosynthesis C-methylase UbiE